MVNIGSKARLLSQGEYTSEEKWSQRQVTKGNDYSHYRSKFDEIKSII